MTAAEFKEAIRPFAEAYARHLLDRGTQPAKVISTVKGQSACGIRSAVYPIVNARADADRRRNEVYQ